METTSDVVESKVHLGTPARIGAAGAGQRQGGGGAVYGLGMIGALAYFAESASSGREYALALGKAIVWPALLVHLAFKRLGG